MRALWHPVWRLVIFGLLAGAVAAFPVCVWGPGEFYRPAWIVLVVCCWGPALIMGVFDRTAENPRDSTKVTLKKRG